MLILALVLQYLELNQLKNNHNKMNTKTLNLFVKTPVLNSVYKYHLVIITTKIRAKRLNLNKWGH